MIPRRDSWNRDEGSRDKLIVCVRVCMYDRMQGRRWSEYLLAVEHPEGFGRHTIDAPVGVPVLVAYRYREPSVIRSDKMDQLSLAALDPQCFPLAGVRGVVPICNRNGRKLLNYRVAEIYIYIYIKRFNYLRKRSKQLNIPFHFSTNSLERNESCQMNNCSKKIQFKKVFRSARTRRKGNLIVPKP